MWWIIGGALGFLIARATRKQMKEDEEHRKETFARWRDNFPGWGE